MPGGQDVGEVHARVAGGRTQRVRGAVGGDTDVIGRDRAGQVGGVGAGGGLDRVAQFPGARSRTEA